MNVENGDKVKVTYEGKLEDGTVFDSSEIHQKPLEFTVGAKQIIPGLENAIIGMAEGEEKEVKIKPTQAYGERNEQYIKKVPKDSIKIDQEIVKGMRLMMKLNEHQMPAEVIEITDNEVTLDLNHPLASKTLIFKVKVEGIEKPAKA